jgi:hypothetical protein
MINHMHSQSILPACNDDATSGRGRRKSLLVISIILLGFIFFPWNCLAIDAWPGGSGTTIATYSDASGLAWNETRNSLFLVQNTGTLVEMDSSGAELDHWAIAGDLEGITLADNDRYIYIGVEYPESILEFDTQAEALTGKSWNLHGVMSGTASQGLEGLAYRDGYFLAGHQGNGKIYVFAVNLDVSDDVSHVDTITPNEDYSSDISGIEYNSNTGMAYVIYDTYDALLELNSSNGIAEHYSLPGSAQEGFALKTNCLSRKADAYIANDDTGTVVKYTNYPITCLDADGDGVSYTTDCNDYDASISASQNYYRDADGDGLGSNTPTPFCSFATPVGYVANHNDPNDNDFDNDGISEGMDCNDYDAAISANQNYYRDADGDGLGDAFTTTGACTFSAPGGYVTNSSDPTDISANGRRMLINGVDLDLFGTDINTVEYTDLNFYSDDWQEIIAVGLKIKRAYITVVKVQGDNVSIAKRRMVKIKKKHTSVSITADTSKQKFTTRFSRGKKYTWKVNSSGSFKKSK